MLNWYSSEDSISIFWRDKKEPLCRACLDAVLSAEGDSWIITRVLVQPKETRRQGIGTKMMDRFKREVQAKKV